VRARSTPGSLFLQRVSPGSWVIHLNTDADGVIEMTIRVTGAIPNAAGLARVLIL
jgi:hypothetical protein